MTRAPRHTGPSRFAALRLNIVRLAFAALAISAAAGFAWADDPSASKTVVQKVPTSAAQSTAPAQAAATPDKSRNPRVLFITSKDSTHSKEELAKLEQRGGEFDKMRALGWLIGTGPENHVQIVDKEQIPELVQKLAVQDYPTVACVDKDEIVRSFRSGCTTPLDAWTFGFLLKGVDERPAGAVLEAARVATTGAYPLRGNHWSVEGDWNPTREQVISHLHGPNHQSQLLSTWHLEEWSYEELRSVHDDLHEKYDMGYTSYRNSGNTGASFLSGKPKF